VELALNLVHTATESLDLRSRECLSSTKLAWCMVAEVKGCGV